MRLLLAAFVLLPLAGCGGQSEARTEHESVTTGAGPGATGTSRLDVADPLTVEHSGTRLVRTGNPTLPVGAGEAQFLERFVSSGEGQFSLEPLAPAAPELPPAKSWALFSILQHLREGYNARSRDFAVRDSRVLRNEWSLHFPGTTAVVAGRTCRRADVVHLRSGRRYELSIDEGTDLILDQSEYDAQGVLVLQVTYLDLDLTPDLSSVVWFQPSPRVEFALDGDFEEAHGFSLHVPTNPPPGYVLRSVSEVDLTTRGDTTGPWVMVTFTNGVDPLFYLLNLPSAKDVQRGARAAAGPDAAGHVLSAYSLGGAAAMSGSLPHGDVAVAGRVSLDELTDLVHSSIPE